MRRSLRFLARYGYAAGATAYLFTAGVRSPRHRGLITHIAEHFGLARSRPRIPTVPLRDLFPDEQAVQLREPEAVDGNVTLLELLVLARAVAAWRPRTLFEIGTFDGRTTLNLAANAPEEAQVFTLDLPAAAMQQTQLPLDAPERRFIDKPASGTRFRGTDVEPRITQLYGDSAAFDFAPYSGSIDFMFVDGSHALEYVLQDSITALELVRGRNACVFWHDYTVWDGVTRALDGLYGDDPRFARLLHVEGTTLVCLPPAEVDALSHRAGAAVGSR
jgi:hypothetical protein